MVVYLLYSQMYNFLVSDMEPGKLSISLEEYLSVIFFHHLRVKAKLLSMNTGYLGAATVNYHLALSSVTFHSGHIKVPEVP